MILSSSHINLTFTAILLHRQHTRVSYRYTTTMPLGESIYKIHRNNIANLRGRRKFEAGDKALTGLSDDNRLCIAYICSWNSKNHP